MWLLLLLQLELASFAALSATVPSSARLDSSSSWTSTELLIHLSPSLATLRSSIFHSHGLDTGRCWRDETIVSLCDSATGLTACLVTEEDESRVVARASHPRDARRAGRAVQSNTGKIELRVHERAGNSDSDYEPEEDGISQNEDDDVADDLEAKCFEMSSFG
eukprot:jgi/Phyca11/13954/fgenesh1_pg.PHYCAscaffold_5_\